MTLLVSNRTSWFQFQVFRSFIQTELIRKHLWKPPPGVKTKKVFFLQMDITHILPPPPKKKKTNCSDLTPKQPNRQIIVNFSNASKPGTFFWDHPIQAVPRLIQAWIGVMSFDSCKEPGRLMWLNQQRRLKAALNSIWFGRYITGLNWIIHPAFHHFLKKRAGSEGETLRCKGAALEGIGHWVHQNWFKHET